MKIDSNSTLTRTARPEMQPSGVSGKEGTEGAQKIDGASARWVPSSAQDGSQDIDMARVDELRDAIREGRFEIRADRIADSLIESARELSQG